MTTIEVKTQRIIVNPPSGHVVVLGYGVAGPEGSPGPPGGIGVVPISDTPPASPTQGNLWLESESMALYAFYDGYWVEVGYPQALDPAVMSYTHVQSTPASVWTITHPLTFKPNVMVVNSADSQVEGEVVYTSPSVITVTFSAGFSGKAYLS